jgi:hypothetical protein
MFEVPLAHFAYLNLSLLPFVWLPSDFTTRNSMLRLRDNLEEFGKVLGTTTPSSLFSTMAGTSVR